MMTPSRVGCALLGALALLALAAPRIQAQSTTTNPLSSSLRPAAVAFRPSVFGTRPMETMSLSQSNVLLELSSTVY